MKTKERNVRKRVPTLVEEITAPMQTAQKTVKRENYAFCIVLLYYPPRLFDVLDFHPPPPFCRTLKMERKSKDDIPINIVPSFSISSSFLFSCL